MQERKVGKGRGSLFTCALALAVAAAGCGREAQSADTRRAEAAAALGADVECIREVCNENGKCHFERAEKGTRCATDGNFCTEDVCNAGGKCTHEAGNAGVECRAAAGVCDAPEFCTGTSADCPADGFQPATVECRGAAGVCDVAELCTGAGADCPADAFALATPCRGAADACDPVELCDGTSVACPADAVSACTICGRAFYDASGDGVSDATEVGLAGWPVSLDDGAASAVTAEDGSYAFTGLPAGVYTVCQGAPAETNWRQSAPPDGCYSVAPVLGAACDKDFGNNCVVGGGGRGQGYWQSKNGAVDFLADDAGVSTLARMVELNLVDEAGLAFDPLSYDEYYRWWLREVYATNMAYMLAVKMATAELNLMRGYVKPTTLVHAAGTKSAKDTDFSTLPDLVAEANEELAGYGLKVANGDPSAADHREYQELLKDMLEAAVEEAETILPAACEASFAQ